MDDSYSDASERVVVLAAHDLPAVSSAREQVERQLLQWGCQAPADAVLVFAELVTNAVVHGGGALRIEIAHRDRCVRIAVFDATAAPPVVRVEQPTVGGWGLKIVEGLSESWGTKPQDGSGGKVVWAMVPCSGAATGNRQA